jgi:Aminoglycoside adenylyltransferase, C-terminal domain
VSVPPGGYLDAVLERLAETLGSELDAVVLGGSAALGAYEPGRSDLDVIAVCVRPLSRTRARALARSLCHRALPCPARRLELVVMTRASAAGDPEARAFELNLNTGAGGSDQVGLDPAAEAVHWFVVDRSIARARGRALFGPPPRDVLAPVPRGEVLAALRDSLDWHAAHEPASPDSVLNACRAWRWARTGRWTSKRAAAEWAHGRMSDPAAIDAGLSARAAGEPLDPATVAGFLDAVRAVLAAARP